MNFNFDNQFIGADELRSLLKPFILRRVKCDVVKDLPNRSDVVLHHDLSKLQKKYYKAILMKDTGKALTDR